MKITIITVCLNNLEGVKRTARSVIEQDFDDFEWVIIDGNSTDGTKDYIKSIAKYFNVIFVSENDTGIYHAMNKGVLLSKGEYLLFLNSGDYLYEKSILSKAYQKLDDLLVVGQILKVFPNQSNNMKFRNLSGQDVRKKYIYHKSLLHPASFISRKLFDLYGLYNANLKICGDWDFFARLLTKGIKVKFINECITVFYANGVSHQVKNLPLMKKEKYLIRKKNFSTLYRLKRTIVDPIEKIFNVNQI